MTAHHAYIAVSVITGLISLVLAGIAYHHRRQAAAASLAWMMLGIVGWCLLPGLSLLIKAETTAYLVTRIAYIFFAVTPVLWVHFSLAYVTRQRPHSRRYAHLFWIGPLVTLSLVWTNGQHHFFWRQLDFYIIDGFLNWKTVFGPGFWLHSLYCYSMIILGAGIILRYSVTTFSIYRKQTIALLAGCLTPLAASVPAVFGLSTYSFTPFGLVFTGLVFTWAVLRSELLNLRPIAREILLEQMQDGMIIVDEKGTVVDLNPQALRMLQRGEAQVLGAPVNQVIGSLTGGEFNLGEQTGQNTEVRLCGQGRECVCSVTISPIQIHARQNIGSLIHLHDITGLKQVEEALRASEGRAHAILSALPDHVQIIDREGTIIAVEKSCAGPGASEKTPTTIFDRYPRPVADKILLTVQDTLQSGECRSLSYQVGSEPEQEHWYQARSAPLKSGPGPAESVVWIDREVSEQMRLYQEVEHLANTDSLTGLANRRHFFHLAQTELEQKASQNSSYAFILIDIDHFKEVNDHYGHLVGDEVLNLVARRLSSQVRAQDIVARYGGEEFAVYLPDTSGRAALQIARRLCRSVASEQFSLGKHRIPISISIGLVSGKIDGKLKIDQMIDQADGALYAAKQAGRNTVKVYQGSSITSAGRA